MNYDVGTWNKQPLYNCRLCPFDTLDEQQMLEHQMVHAAPPPVEEVQVVLLDKWGNVQGIDTVTVTAPPTAEPKRATKKREVGDGENSTN